MRELCNSAQNGKPCCDDLCRSNPDNTLCGFSQEEYDDVTRDYDSEEFFSEGEQAALEAEADYWNEVSLRGAATPPKQ